MSFGNNSRIVILPGLQEEKEGYIKSCFSRHVYPPALGSKEPKEQRTDGKPSDGQGLVLQCKFSKNQDRP